MSVHQLAEAMASENPPILLDVREDAEVAADHLPNIVHIPLADLQLRATELPVCQPIAVICKVGGRSARATAFLISEGFEAVNVAGGMLAYRTEIA
ncbi:MAG: rhodanese-like domain-containing protein [Pseudomonas fluorescens]|nr:MAG: rhodanese-like domain-containing protein [Pseudomonas fluorescens]